MKRGRFGQFLACTGYPECKTTRKLIATKQGGLRAAKPDQILDEKCPRCSANLVIKQGRFGEFTACTKYPECKYVKHKTTGVEVPEGRRQGRRGRRAEVEARQDVLRLLELSRLRLRAVEPPDRRAVPEVRRAVPRREDHQEARPPDPLQQRGVRLRRAPKSCRRRPPATCSRDARGTNVDGSRSWHRGCELMITSSAAGSPAREAAWQAASRGVPVTLYEMRPVRPTAVHKTDRLAELVCSNSFRGDKLDNAVGLLKEEMRRLGSLVMRAAEASRVPAGAALAVDRERFADVDHARARRASARSRSSARRSPPIPDVDRARPGHRRDRAADLRRAVGGHRAAGRRRASVLLRRDQPDRARRDASIATKVFRQSRWDRSLRSGRRAGSGAELQARPAAGPRAASTTGEGDYLNCPLTREEYERFYDALVARRVGDGPRLRQGAVLRRLPADRGDGAPRRATRCGSGR